MSSRLARNALANGSQVLIGAPLLFALYRYINTTLGIELLGVWSVILATVSASRLADLGLSAGVTRFVARHRARDELDSAAVVIDTATLTLIILVGAALPLLFPLISKLLPHLFEVDHLHQAQKILPFAFISLWLTIVSAVFQGGLDGCQRMDLRAGLVIAGQALLLLLAFWLVPQHGLVGLAWAQIGQGLFLMVSGRLLLRHVLPTLPILPLHWRKYVLREMLVYGANVQAATVFMLLLDPVAKALIINFGGAATAGNFEMASQVVYKARALIVAANRAIVPHVASLAATVPAHIMELYRGNVRILVFMTLPVFTLLIAWASGISWLLAGTQEREFVFLLSILTVTWSSNIFAGPAYFTNMGTGHVGWNTLSLVIMGALNASLGWLLGSLYGAHGVAIAYSISIMIGSFALIAVFQRQNNLDWSNVFAREHLGLFSACVAVVVLSQLLTIGSEAEPPVYVAAIIFLPILVLGASMWFHPLRRQLLVWVKKPAISL